MRLFIGSLLDEANRVHLDHFVDKLLDAHPALLKRIPPRSAHLTYVFCSDAGPAAVAALVEAVRQFAESQPPFDIRFGSPHVIAPGATPRVLCASLLNGDAAVRALTKELFEALDRAWPGLPLSPSKAAHVTLGRFKKHARRSDAHVVAEWLSRRASPLQLRDRIEGLQLLSSTLTPAGPTYAVVSENLLRGGIRRR